MALTVSHTSHAHHNLGTLHGILSHDDVTEYATNGWAPTAKPPSILGLIVIWQENADYNFRWDATNEKIKAYVMSTGAEAGAVDVGELKYILVSATGA